MKKQTLSSNQVSARAPGEGCESVYLKQGAKDYILGLAVRRGLRVGAREKEQAVWFDSSEKTLREVFAGRRPLSAGLARTFKHKLGVGDGAFNCWLSPLPVVHAREQGTDRSLTFEEWLAEIGDLAAQIKDRQRFLRSTCSRLLLRGKPEDKLEDPVIDYLYVFGWRRVLRFKRIRGRHLMRKPAEIFSCPVASLPEGKVVSFNFLQEDGHIRKVTSGSDQELTAAPSLAPVDFLSVALFTDDMPELGDWISIETRKYVVNGKGRLRFLLISVADFKQLEVWNLSAADMNHFEQTLQFRPVERIVAANSEREHLSSFKDWFSLLDEVRSTSASGSSDRASAKRFLDECLDNLDICRDRRLQSFSEITEASSVLGGELVELSNLADPYVITFRFCDPSRLTKLPS